MISVVVCSAEEEKLASIEKQYAKAMADEPYELVVMRDVPSLAKGYNDGLRESKGEIVVFSHDDIQFLGADVPARLKEHLSRFDGIGIAGTDLMAAGTWGAAGLPHLFGQIAHRTPDGFNVCIYAAQARVVPHMQGMDGVFLAFRRDVIEKVGWDEQTFDGFHFYDLDCTFRAHKMGYNLAAVCDVPICHASGGSYNADWQKYAQRFVRKHGDSLAPRTENAYNFATVQVRTKMEALAVMTPTYWADESNG